MEFEHKGGALDEEDLVVADKEEKNWKGIVISLLVISSILAAIIVAIVLCTPAGEVDNNRLKLDFDHVISDVFNSQPFNGSWLSEHEFIYIDQNGSIVIFDASNQTTAKEAGSSSPSSSPSASSRVLVKTYDKTLHTMTKFSLSPDRQSILFVGDVRHEFGAPVSAKYAIFNISSQTVEFLDDLVKSGQQALKTPRIQYANWAGPSSNSIVFIEANDIYFVPDFARSNLAGGKYLRLTKSGQLSESVSNGLPDNLYRSSVFSEPGEPCLWLSGDGRFLAYLSFDDSLVEPTPIEFYDGYLHESNTSPQIHMERYARAGYLIPRVSVHIVDLAKASASSGLDDLSELSATIAPPSELAKQLQSDPRLGHYVTHVSWLPNQHKLMVLWTNRAQNSSILTQCEHQESRAPAKSSFLYGGSGDSGSGSWRCDLLTTFSQRITPNVQSKQTMLATYNAKGTRLIFVVLPRPDSIIGDHYHVAMLRGDERAPKYLTHGQFDIDRLISYDVHTDTLYFEAKLSEQAERHLYKISSIAQLTARQTKCLTCQLAEPCDYNHAHISPGAKAKYLIHECLGPGVPVTRLRLLDDLTSLHELNKNEKLESFVKSKQMPIEKYLAIRINHQQVPYEVHIKLYLPTELEESEKEHEKRFPLLIESSEISQRKVWKKFELDWGKYLASRKQLIYAKLDCVRTRTLGGPTSGGSYHSASGFYSTGLLDEGDSSEELSEQSPLLNAKDQINVIKFLVENVDLFPYIDRKRIAIWGPTSTSAYLALATTVEDDNKLIQCTVAVSPITNWRYMSAYTAEHYLGLPWLDSNSLKYEHANLLKRHHEFSLRKLLIVHGTADEQVHVQNSMQFIKSLTENHLMNGAAIHQMQLYPDVGHSLSQVKRHFYLTLEGFIDRCFYQKPIIATKAIEWKGKVRPKLY